MHLRTLLLVAALSALAAPAAAADASISSVDGLVGLLEEMGHSVVEQTEDDGPNLSVDGGSWAISLGDCTDRADCRYGWVWAYREIDKYVGPDCANDWNAAELFGTVWIDGVSQPWLFTTVNLQGNPGKESVRSSLDWYKTQLVTFEEYIQTCYAVGKDKS